MKPFIQQGQKDVARDHSAAWSIGYDAYTQAVDETGLLWVGKAGSDPKVKLQRGQNGGLDQWWTNETEEIQIARKFDEHTSYVLKMPRKK
eukprot:CAMPEP_0114693380 /NCGR_PEP_ID=MMETSP0191-20121206/69015_1 /TAXON_ID=126664 /ORGANISM="Sorites sp." /LENGTH=89 /DNA_ID=CAMNT_0001986995 /DNA_START=118 /DNA_END=387 /DNA_ORIENTATION=-